MDVDYGGYSVMSAKAEIFLGLFWFIYINIYNINNNNINMMLDCRKGTLIKPAGLFI